MGSSFYFLNQSRIPTVLLISAVYVSLIGCRTQPDPPLPASAGTGGAPSAASLMGASGVATDAVPCAPAVAGARPHPGNFDTASCNRAGCHEGYVGGWLYTDNKADEVVTEATVTVTNEDGSVVTATSAPDGFFSLIGNSQMLGKIPGSFKVCVSKCPNTVCATQTHTSADCQTGGCHGGDSPKIYLTQANPTANAGSGGDSGCNLPSGGSRVHNADIYDSQSCRACHGDIYTGGFVYDGLTGNAPVARATVTVTPAGRAPLVAITGPGGMFYYPGVVSAPYTACVSKCNVKLCSAAGTHVNTQDCRECHDETNRIHIP